MLVWDRLDRLVSHMSLPLLLISDAVLITERSPFIVTHSTITRCMDWFQYDRKLDLRDYVDLDDTFEPKSIITHTSLA